MAEHPPTEGEHLVEVSREGSTATVSLCRPRALNAITAELLGELRAVLEGLSGDDEIRVVVLAGRGRAFSAGVDLKVLQEHPLAAGAISDTFNDRARDVITLLATMPKVTIARVHGVCYTGALELALACDLLVVADDARLADTHAKWGLRPTWGMSQRLIRAVGPGRARELSYTAREFSGVDAARWELAVRSVPAEQLEGAVAELAEAIAANSPASVAAYKDLYRVALETNLADGLAYEARTTYPIADTDERLAGFLKK